MRLPVFLALLTLSLLAIAPAAQADTFSKKYRFVSDKTLEVGESVGSGMRLDSVQFVLPAPSGESILRIGGLPEAVVAISNMSQDSIKVGVAIAVYDEEGRLLGVASGGSAMRGIRAYPLLEGVRGEARVDIEFIEELILRLAQLVRDVDGIAELDFNPVIVTPERKHCRVVDARVRVASA